MFHLKDKIDNKDIIYAIDSVKNIEEFLDLVKNDKEFDKGRYYDELLKNKYIFSDGAVSDKFIISMIKDSDISEYIIESNEFIGTFIDEEDLKIDTDKDYLFLYDEEMSIMIPAEKIKTCHDEYYKIYLEDLIYVNNRLISFCDGCSCKSLKALLFNLYPEINTGLNEKYLDFKGSVCSECLSKMEQGLPLSNEEKENITFDNDVTEKIDEFSSIEDILKFCKIDNEEELEKIIKNKIDS